MAESMPVERVEIFDTVTSTNKLALERAVAGEAAGLWLVAKAQSAGQGRLGRSWLSEPGNLYCSYLYDPPVGPLVGRERVGELPLVVGLAVHDAISAAVPPTLRARIALKWPNDVLVDGAKISGILLEGLSCGDTLRVVIGIGVNCRAAPPAGTALYPTASLCDLGADVDATGLFSLVRRSLRLRLDAWQAGDPAGLRADWLARAQGLGEPITVRLATETRAGVFVGLDPIGRLLLRGDDGEVAHISAADVFFAK